FILSRGFLGVVDVADSQASDGESGALADSLIGVVAQGADDGGKYELALYRPDEFHSQEADAALLRQARLPNPWMRCGRSQRVQCDLPAPLGALAVQHVEPLRQLAAAQFGIVVVGADATRE